MDTSPSLQEIISRLQVCLADLDRYGAVIAASHLDACLQELNDPFISDQSPPEQD